MQAASTFLPRACVGAKEAWTRHEQNNAILELEDIIEKD